MRDDERYPIPTQAYPDGEMPQVVSDPHPEHYADPQDKYLDTNEPGGSQGGPGKKDDEVTEGTPRGATICGLRRRTFWIVIAVIAVVVIAALVGGLVGGLKARDASGTSGSDSSSTSTSTSPPVPSATGPLEPSKRAMTAATNSGSAGSTLQIFYQDLDTTDILYRLVWEDDSEAEHSVDLELPPIQGTTLAATASNMTNGEGLDVNLFYLSINNTSDLTIARAALECSKGAATCRTASNHVISDKFATGVNAASGLAAVLLDNEASRFRVYFQAPGGLVWALVGDEPSKNGWSAHQIGGPAVQGSSIAASLEGEKGGIMVAFVFNATGTLRAVEYTDSVGAQGGQDVYSRSGSGFAGTSRFTACYAPTVDEYHIYYVGRTTHDIISYYRGGMKSDWKPNQDKKWHTADGGVACVAWGDQVRLLYMNGGKLAMNKQSNVTWSEVEHL